MKYFFALKPGRRFALDEDYMAKHKWALIARNLAAVVVYGLIVAQVQHSSQLLALVLTVFSACHALMIGVVLGRGSNEES